jgi:hypothetical protein
VNDEPVITVNGVALSRGATISVRVAVNHHLSWLKEDDAALGRDGHGVAMREGYIGHLEKVVVAMAGADDEAAVLARADPYFLAALEVVAIGWLRTVDYDKIANAGDVASLSLASVLSRWLASRGVMVIRNKKGG